MLKHLCSFFIIVGTISNIFGNSQKEILPVYQTPSTQIQTNSNNNIKICGLRISFPEDDNETTTGDGRFLLNPNLEDTVCQSFRIDPPPHNRAYFKDHIKSLANYYYSVSNSNLVIDTLQSEIYPIANNSSYQVSRTIDYYHPFLEEDSIDIRLAELLSEAVTAADSEVVFSNFDVVVVFHAGVGQDFNILLDPTPYDIPSVYLNENDLELALGSDGNFQGIPVENSDHYITEGIILPECQNHILWDNWDEVFGSGSPCSYQMGLNGTFAFMFGFYLGLPGLYDTETGSPGIGKFGLMDQGSANLNGLVPPLPSAWEREFLNWIEPVEADEYQELLLDHAERGTDSTVWKIPIDNDEYFLIENRWAEVRPGVSLDSIQYQAYQNSSNNDFFPPIFPFLRDSADAYFSPVTGVMLSIPRYDVSLPGSGLLIWHIDESVIDANIAENKVNTNRDRFGVDLEEGDGAQDLGYESQMIGADVDVGWYFDPWFAGNDGFWDLNPDYPEDEEMRVGFTDYTYPSARSNDLGLSGIVIDSIGPSGEVMSLRIKRESASGNFPVTISSNRNPLIRKIDIDPDNSGEEFLVFADSIYLYNSDGSVKANVEFTTDRDSIETVNPLIVSTDNSNSLYLLNKKINGEYFLSAWDIGRTITSINKLEIGNITRTSNLLSFGSSIIFGAKKNNDILIKYSPETNSINDIPLNFSITHLAGNSSNCFALTDDNRLMYISALSAFNAEELGTISAATTEIIVGYLNDNEYADIAVAGDNISLFLDPNSSDMNTKQIVLDEPATSLLFSDIDGDEKVEIILNTATKIYAFNEQLISEQNFPISIPNIYKENGFASILLTADCNGDEILDIISSLQNVGTIAFNNSGNVISGFPKSYPQYQSGGEILLNSLKGVLKIAVCETGEMNTWKIGSCLISGQELSEEAWTNKGGNYSANYFYNVHSAGQTISATNLLNKKKTYNWPNPVKESETKIRYFVNRECNITIEIYDLAGDFVTSLKDNSPTVGDYSEKSWNVSNIENGVYFAVVKASAGSKSESKIVKIMVMK